MRRSRCPGSEETRQKRERGYLGFKSPRPSIIEGSMKLDPNPVSADQKNLGLSVRFLCHYL